MTNSEKKQDKKPKVRTEQTKTKISKPKFYLLISIGAALIILLFNLYFRGILLARGAYSICRVLGDSFLVVALLFLAVWLLFMAWYNGILDFISYQTSASRFMHLENGKIVPKRTMSEFSEQRKKQRVKPTYLLWVWVTAMVPAIIFSVITILLGQ
ncbi:MAG: hypothetical protein J5589_08435 [Firmicutes bacterium]|nr:hypothetical protein [Bacillota bacterium]